MPKTKKIKRTIPPAVILRLWNSSAGSCQFPGCNKSLWRHDLTLTPGNFWEMAHIIGVNWPRSDERSAELAQDFDNILLLCPECHKLIDTDVDSHPEELLHQWKRESEERLSILLGMRENQKRKVLIFRTAISKEKLPIIGRKDFSEALRENGNYPATQYSEDINFTSLTYESLDWQNMEMQLSSRMTSFHKDIEQDKDMQNGIAVFAIWAIPLLIKLGAELPYTVPIDIYQKSRVTQKWMASPESDATVLPTLTRLCDGNSWKNVVVMISLSGTIDMSCLPESIDPAWTTYSITLPEGIPGLVYTRSFIEYFISLWLKVQRLVMEEHGTDSTIHIFAAIPSAIAIHMGHARLHSLSPTLELYEFNKDTKKFFSTLTLK